MRIPSKGQVFFTVSMKSIENKSVHPVSQFFQVIFFSFQSATLIFGGWVIFFIMIFECLNILIINTTVMTYSTWLLTQQVK